jgi:hypothetical protein
VGRRPGISRRQPTEPLVDLANRILAARTFEQGEPGRELEESAAGRRRRDLLQDKEPKRNGQRLTLAKECQQDPGGSRNGLPPGRACREYLDVPFRGDRDVAQLRDSRRVRSPAAQQDGMKFLRDGHGLEPGKRRLSRDQACQVDTSRGHPAED